MISMDYGKGNKVVFARKINRCKIDILGKNNNIEINSQADIKNLVLDIHGNNNRIILAVVKKDILWSRELPRKLVIEKVSDFSKIAVLDIHNTEVENCFDTERVISGWAFLSGEDSALTDTFVELSTKNKDCFTFKANKTRREDVQKVFDTEESSESGFWFKIPDHIDLSAIYRIRIITKCGNIISGKEILK